MFPVDRVKKTNADYRIAFLHFAAVKKPQQNHTLAHSGSHRRSDSPKRVGGARVGERKQSRWRFCWLPTALLFSDARRSCSMHNSSTLEIVIA